MADLREGGGTPLVFPRGIYVEKFDTLFQTEASIKADTAYYYDKKGLWELIGNVEVESLQGEAFWDFPIVLGPEAGEGLFW